MRKQRTCEECGGPIPFLLASGKHNSSYYVQRFCGLACYGRWKSAHEVGPSANAWRGGNITVNGYRTICTTGDGKRVYEHRHVMEQHLGRPLRRGETVHHKDGNKLNNIIANLRLLDSRGDHVRTHVKAFRSDTHKECTRCHEIKSREAFYKIRRPGWDAHHSWCKACQIAHVRAK